VLQPLHGGRRTEEWLRPSALAHVLVVSAAATAAIAAIVLFGAGGWEYYRTPLRVRAYAPAHAALRPSGTIGQALGIAGLLMMTVPVLYSVRKKWKRLARMGEMRHWLNVHIFCGIVGPVLVTFHAAMKFNGLISVAYWSMVVVVLSGFVGRYLYVRMPRTIRGIELTYEEILTKAAGLRREMAATGLSPGLLALLDALSPPASGTGVVAPGPPPGWLRRRRLVRAMRRGLRQGQVPRQVAHEVIRLARERAFLLRRLAYLQRTRHLFALWHVLHQPLVYLMFAIAVLHVSLVAYLGYAFLPW